MTMLRFLISAALLLFAAGAASADPALTVGAIYVGSTNDYGYNRSMHDGLMAMKAAIPGVTVLEAENVPETAEAERVMEGMIQQGAKLIFATSFGHQQSAFDLAKKHPDVVFEHAGGWMQAPNFGNFFGATQAAWYPMGVAAGLMTKSNTLGFVVGVPIGYAIGNVNAFALGARSVNPKAQVRVVVVGSWSDKAKEAAATNALIDEGADVVAMHVDSPATVIQAAESRGAYSIGFQSVEARALAPKGWITGLGFTWGPFMTRDRQERDRRNLQARHGSRRSGGDDYGRAVRQRRAGDSPGASYRRRRQGRQGLQSFHRADCRQYRCCADQGRRGLGRRQDGQFRLVCRRCHRKGEIAHGRTLRSRRVCARGRSGDRIAAATRRSRRRHRRLRGAGARRRTLNGVPAA